MCRASHEGGRRCPGSNAGATARQRRSRARRRLRTACEELAAAEEAQDPAATKAAQQRIAAASEALSPEEAQAVVQASGAGHGVPGSADHDAGPAAGDSKACPPRLVVPTQAPIDTSPLGGDSARTELLTYSDGTVLVRKQNDRHSLADGYDPVAMTDAEELAPLVLDACALQTAAVHRSGPVEVYMEFVEGTRGDQLDIHGEDASDIAPATVQGRRMGLADALIINSDRNEENWVRTPDRKLVGFDHGDAFYQFEHPRSPYADPLYDMSGDKPRAVPNDFTQADMAVVGERLRALRPRFSQRGRDDWHDRMMRQFDELAAQAEGSMDLIAGQS